MSRSHGAGGKLEIRNIKKLSDSNVIINVVSKTVKEVYPRYYPGEVVTFFLLFHSEEKVMKDIVDGNVWVLVHDGQVIGTGSMEENHITRVYILPEYQGNGYGTFLIEKLEKELGKKYDSVLVDASLPACCLYEKLGYRTVKHERMALMNDAVLVYEVMEKRLDGKDARI